MGGNTLRRATLALLFLAIASLTSGLETRNYRSRMPDGTQAGPPGGPARQSHVGPEVYRIDRPSTALAAAVESLAVRFAPTIYPALDRMDPYRDEMIRLFAARDLPRELLAVPLIESHFTVGAVSRSGAVGPWQFMHHSTPNWMRMREDLDDRRDIFFATLAAVDKLAHNYSVLGDWWAAVTAYNGGLGLVSRAMSEHDAATPRERFLAAYPDLPDEPREYLVKFLAVAPLVAYPGRHGVELDWNPPVRWDFVLLDRPVDLVELAKRTGLDPTLVLEANAASAGPVTPAQGHVLRFPADYGELVRQELRRSFPHGGDPDDG